MARIGGTNDTVTDTSLGQSYDTWVSSISSSANPGGTLDSIELFLSATSTTFDDCVIGLYEGGVSDTDPDGATEIAQTNFLDLSGNYSLSSTPAWLTFNFSSESITADTRLWVVVRPHYYVDLHFIDPVGSSSSIGDLANGYSRYDGDYNVSTILPATLPAYSTNTGFSTYPFKCAVNYTEAGGGIIQHAMHHYTKNSGSGL